VHVPATWLRALAEVLPPADSLTLRVADGRVFTESPSCPVVAPAAQSELITAQDRKRRILRAAGALNAFQIGKEDIEYLVDQSELDGGHGYHPDEHRLLKIMAEAWALLAVFGVGAEEIYWLVQHRFRQAWNSGRRNV
jgi:hypothetical protein